MLHLAAPTDAGWYARIAPHLPTLLIDHAHLEKRAASTAMSMIFRYSDQHELARALAEVVHEELEHFTRMLGLLEARGLSLVRLEPAPYAAKLASHARKGDPEALLDRLLIASLIEARSCERFQILAAQVEDAELGQFYAELYRDEARHHTLYTNLAREQFGHEVVSARLDELAAYEVEALKQSAGEPRLHAW